MKGDVREDGLPVVWTVVALLIGYVVIRTLGLPPFLLLGWITAAVVVSLASPVTGLSVLVAIGPFTGAVDDDGSLTAVPFLLAALGVAVAARVALEVRRRARAPWFAELRQRLTGTNVTILLAVLLAAGTALGVLHAFRFSPELGRASAELWVPGMGGGIAVFLAAAWCARRGEALPLYAAAASVALAAAVSILDFVTDGGVNASFIGWLVHAPLEGQPRLGGVILAPNAAATIFLMGAALNGSVAAMRGGYERLRTAAVIATAVCLAAIVLTYSRSALIAALVLFAVIAWRSRRWQGLAALAVAAATFGVVYVVAFQGDLLRDVPAVADQQRIDAWSAAIRMWLDRPLYGVGFRAFEWLHGEYGSVLNAPHNEWLRLFAEEGLFVGLIGIGFVVGAVHTARSAIEPVATAVIGGALALAIMATFNNPFFYAQVNVPAFTLLGFALLRHVASPLLPEPASKADATSSGTDDSAGDAPASKRSSMGGLIQVVETLVLTVVIFFVIQTFVAQPFEVQQESMRTTLEEGQYVLVDKLTPHFDSYSRGDIVVFNPVRRDSCSGGSAEPLPRPTPYIKRVIGEPGDHIEIRDDSVYINGSLLVEPYVHGLPTGALEETSSWVVAADRLFVMGDNRPDSIDSRSDQIGEICAGDVIGRAFLRYWPLKAFGILPTPTYDTGATPTPQPTQAEGTVSPTQATPAPTQSNGSPVEVERLRVEVVETRPHDPASFTEGLTLVDGRLYESSAYGRGTLREVDPQSGTVLRSTTIDPAYFAEGIAVVGDRIVQLTWQSHKAFVFALDDFHEVGSFTYETEGWGLCDDGTRLVMSDGTSTLYLRERDTFDLLGTIDVTLDGAPLEQLNELECVAGKVYANVWHSDEIVRVEPSSGVVDQVIDASGLLAPEDNPGDEEAVLNGIAYAPGSDTFLLTGKLWPKLFVVRFVPA
jgi:signal peptidase I